MVKMFKLLT